MKQILILALLITAGSAKGYAQPAYSGMFNMAGVYGNDKTKIQIQTIHGVKLKTWFAGAGIAIDDYFKQSIPVFIDLRKNILKQPSSPFVYADGGINYLNRNTENAYIKSNLKSGGYYDIGAGYKFSVSEKLAINISVGHSFKGFTEKSFTHPYSPTPPYRTDEWIMSSTQKFSLQRFILRIGLQL
jgi:hypothetical protein